MLLLCSLLASYVTISLTHMCGHVMGGFPALCAARPKIVPLSLSDCENACTNFYDCKGYSFKESEGYCNLMTTKENNCPLDYYYFPGHYTVDSNSIIASSSPMGEGYNCMAKSGMIPRFRNFSNAGILTHML